MTSTQRDANEWAIVEALRRAGCSVEHLDFPADLLVGIWGCNHLLEIKRPLGPRGGSSGRKLSKTQARFAARWKGSVHVVRTPEEALHAVFESTRGGRP